MIAATRVGWLLALACALSIAAVIALVLTVGNHPADTGEPSNTAIERSEAEALLKQAVDLAQNPRILGFCHQIAVSAMMCNTQLIEAQSSSWFPDTRQPQIVGTRVDDSTATTPILILHVTGTRQDGTPYEADFATTRARMPSGPVLRSLTPVYWSGVKYSSTQCGGAAAGLGADCGISSVAVAPNS